MSRRLLEAEIDNLAGEVETLTARLSVAEAALAGRSPAALAPIAAIIADAAQLFEIPIGDILSDRKLQGITETRFAIAWVAKHATSYSLPRIAGALHRKDHSTIINALRRAEELRASDPVFKARTDRLLSGAMQRRR